MTRTILLYEYVTGGGSLSAVPPTLPSGSWLREGTAMLLALAADFLALPDTELLLLRDARLPHVPWPRGRFVEVRRAAEERAALEAFAREADATVLIAPEFQRALLERCVAVEAVGGRLRSPDSAFVELTGDKQRCAERLLAAGVGAPRGSYLRPGQPLPRDFPYPALLKPCDGAGSQGIQWLADADAAYDASELGTLARLEPFHAGLPVSVAVLCGPGRQVPLPACRQWLTADGTFKYLGGEAPLAEPWAGRAQRLALAAMRVLPPTWGYVGLDLVLGADADGRADVVVEVNPRLTTSYVGLRQLAATNLAGAMLEVAAGHAVRLPFASRVVQFHADGRILSEAGAQP